MPAFSNETIESWRRGRVRSQDPVSDLSSEQAIRALVVAQDDFVQETQRLKDAEAQVLESRECITALRNKIAALRALIGVAT